MVLLLTMEQTSLLAALLSCWEINEFNTFSDRLSSPLPSRLGGKTNCANLPLSEDIMIISIL